MVLATRNTSEAPKIIPVDVYDPSLVLYLPLWYPYSDMDGSTIYSYDKNRHSCTVTGAVWQPYGRLFDGDDYLDCGTPAALNIRTFTIEMWVYPTKVDATAVFAVKGNEAPWANFSWRLRVVATGKLSFVASTGAAASFDLVSDANNAITINAWNYLVGVADHSNTTATTYIDATQDKQDTSIGTTQLDATFSQWIGARKRATPDNFIQGRIGEVRIYNRALSAAEVTHNYNATRWRYR